MNLEWDGIEQQIIDAERFHEELAEGFIHRSDGTIELVKEFEASLYLKGVLRLVEDAVVTTGQVSLLTTSSRGRSSIRFNRLGFDLYLACIQYEAKICRLVAGKLKPLYEGRILHPGLDLALALIAEFQARVRHAASTNHEALHELINELATAIRSRYRDGDVRKHTENFRRNSRAKLRRALRYVLSLFGKRSRLLILRVDLYVRPRSRDWSYTKEADAAFDHFADALSKGEIVPDVVGWMIAREDGLERGQHYHCLIAIDGHEHHAGVNLAKLIGEYWVHQCVGSAETASYFNCFTLVDKYKYLGIGMVRFDDEAKLLGLYYAIRYLCKERVMLLPNSERPRNFRRGVIDESYVRRGAPRRNDDDLAVARRVLLGKRPKKTKRMRMDVRFRYRPR